MHPQAISTVSTVPWKRGFTSMATSPLIAHHKIDPDRPAAPARGRDTLGNGDHLPAPRDDRTGLPIRRTRRQTRRCPGGSARWLAMAIAAGTVGNTADAGRNAGDQFLPDVRDILIQGPPRGHLLIGSDHGIPPPAGTAPGLDHGRVLAFRQEPGYRDIKGFEEVLGIELVEEAGNGFRRVFPGAAREAVRVSAPDVGTKKSKRCRLQIRSMAPGRSARSSNFSRSFVYHERSWSQKWSTAQTS